MARIRTIKPDFWSDEKIVELTPWARLLFIGLWNFSDDDGRMAYSPKKIKMLVFPGDEVDVSSCLQELCREDLIRVYEREGGRYLAICKLGKHQRIDRKSTSQVPAPLDESSTSEQRTVDEPSTSPQREIDEPSTTEGNGKEGIKESKGTSAPSQAPAKEVDSRFQPLVDVIHERYRTMNGTDCPWSPKEGKQAKDLLRSLDAKDWTIEKLDRCAQFKLLSLDHPATEAPHLWLSRLPSYYEAPLDRFGRPDFEKLDRWLRKSEKKSAPASPPVSSPAPKAPDPAIAEFVESLPSDPWTIVLDHLAKRGVSKLSFETWLKPTKFLRVEGRDLIVGTPTKDFTYITERWGGTIVEIMQGLHFPFEEIVLEAIS